MEAPPPFLVGAGLAFGSGSLRLRAVCEPVAKVRVRPGPVSLHDLGGPVRSDARVSFRVEGNVGAISKSSEVGEWEVGKVL